MFFKVVAFLLAAMVAYFVIENGFDYQKAVLFTLMPLSTLLGYLLFGISD